VGRGREGSLSAETSYHSRARVLFDPADGPPQGWSHWLWGGHSGDPAGTHLWTACATHTDSDGQCDSIDPDDDNDGDPGRTDCADTGASIYTGAPEHCADDVDQDCDGTEAAADGDPECWDLAGCEGCEAAIAANGAPGLLLPLAAWAGRRRRRL
jgi:hypothetical protein